MYAFIFQTKRNIQLLSRVARLAQEPSVRAALQDLHLLRSDVPKGFEKFFKKPKAPSAKSASKASETASKSNDNTKKGSSEADKKSSTAAEDDEKWPPKEKIGTYFCLVFFNIHEGCCIGVETLGNFEGKLRFPMQNRGALDKLSR